MAADITSAGNNVSLTVNQGSVTKSNLSNNNGNFAQALDSSANHNTSLVSFSGATAIMTATARGGTQVGRAGEQTAQAAATTGTTGTVAYGAGATALPGGDMSGGTGMGLTGGSTGGTTSGLSSSSAIGASSGGDSSGALLNATKQMQETQMSFNLQYLQLQAQMQNDNRQYTAVSNIMKTKHDTVKNTISNVH